MSMDKSLIVKSALTRRRNVLSRAERIERLEQEEKWQEGDSVFGIPKVAVARAAKRHKEAKAEEPEAAAAEGTAEETPAEEQDAEAK